MRLPVLAVVGLALSASGYAQTPSDEAALAELSAAIDVYVSLHRQLEGPVPTVKISDNADEIKAAVKALGGKIRAARQGVKPGNIFTPQVAALIRSRISSGCDGDFDAVHAAAHDELPPTPRAVVNGGWPGSALTFMPPSVLCQLPPLPEELEYRFLHRDLVLWDVHADVVVDVLRGALVVQKR